MTLKQAIKQKNISEIRKISSSTPLADLADNLENLTKAERIIYFTLLKTEQQSEIFSFLEPEYQEDLAKSFTDQQIKDIIGELYASEIADLIEAFPEKLSQKILKNTDKETRHDVNKILKYDEDHTGSIMNVDIVTLKQSLTVGNAIEEIKAERDEARLAHYYFVTDAKGKLTGYIAVEDLLFNPKSKKIKTLIKPVASVMTTDDKEYAALQFAEHDMSVLPVVNSNKEVIGMITSDEVIDVLAEEATEDIERMAGIESSNDVPYSKQTVWAILKSRIWWLMLLMISATLSQIVLDAFQGFSSDSLDKASATGASIGIWTTALVAILPVISGAAGNAGSQSSTTIIRSLAIGDIDNKSYIKVFSKELRVSTIMGFALGLANFIRLIIYYSVKGDFDFEHIMLSVAASVSLMVVIVLAKVVGGLLPLVAKSLKLDPAVMAAPLLTTLIDTLSTMIFFGISIGVMALVL